MMTERISLTNQQNNVEQSAPFPTSPLTFPDTNPNILIGEDIVTQDVIPDSETEVEKIRRIANQSEYNEVARAIANTGTELVFANQFASSDLQRMQLTTDYAEAVTFLGEDLTEDQKAKLATQALDVLKEMPQTEIVKRLIGENRSVAQLVSQRSVELQAAREDTRGIEDSMKTRKVLLAIQQRDIDEDSPLYAHIQAEIAYIDSIIERAKVPAKIVDFDAITMPTTDELEAQLTHVTPEAVSPPRGITIARMGHAVVDFLVELPHMVKDKLILDETTLDKPELTRK